ncbi:hypothetical protein P3W45_001672 [Vairimorpha bombi]
MGYDEFVAYYRPILDFTEDEFQTFCDFLKIPLLSALRITESKFKGRVEKKLKDLKKNKYFADVYEASKKNLPHRNFIVNQTRVGHIQRQEVVSMLPVILMGMKKEFSVLDMCAAPGSKTKQLLEMIGDEGLVVCNEVSENRLHVLVSETCKIPRKSFIVVKHDASKLPVFKNDFDRVLCDVPCSGDGTSRKNPEVIPTWNINNSLSLCNLQYKILKRALKFVKHDGLIIYSTCSMNPIENECIVQRVVLEEDLEIVDLRDNVNEKFLSKKFKFREGLTKWDLEDIGLSKCIRVYPHDQNTGGFFIVGLRKKTPKKQDIHWGKPRLPIYIVDDKLREKLSKEYDIKDKTLIQRRKGATIIYEVSKEVLTIVKKTSLNVMYFGYKLFERCSLCESGFYLKTVTDEFRNRPHDLELSGETLVEGIEKKTVETKHQKGSVLVLLKEFDTLVSGYSHGDKITLNINDKLQRALRDYIR